MKRKKESKYPPYPGSNWDYGLKMAAAQMLLPSNKCICIYCRQQAKTEKGIKHISDCPTMRKK